MSEDSRLKVLFVEDDPVVRLIGRRVLDAAGHAVVEAASVAEASAALGGKIWVSDRDGGGAVFVLELP